VFNLLILLIHFNKEAGDNYHEYYRSNLHKSFYILSPAITFYQKDNEKSRLRIWQKGIRLLLCLRGDSSIGIVTGYVLKGRGSIPGRDKVLSTPQRPDRLWGPLRLVFKGYQCYFPGGNVASA
jgi:hypothetical protein